MKKLFALMLALVMSLSLVACGGSSDSGAAADDTAAEGAKVVKIGVYEPQTGDNGAGGKQEILGMEYAHSLFPTVEIGGETYEVKLEIVDNRTSAENGPSAASELVNRDVSIVLGSYGSGVSIAGGTVFEEAGVPAIGTSCTNPQVTSDCSVYFRLAFLDPFQGTVLANYAYNELGVTTAYVLGMLGSDYDQGLMYYFRDAFEKMGGTVVAETFTEGTGDFTAYLNNAINAGAEVVFAPSSTTSASLIINQAASMNVPFAVMAGDTWESSVILEAAKGTNLTICCSTFFDEKSSEVAGQFVAGFKAWMNANPDKLTNNGGNDIVAAVSALGFDAQKSYLQSFQTLYNL